MAVALMAATYDNAYAYLDPSTGSYVFQTVLAGLLGGMFALKLFWKNLRSRVGDFFVRSSDAGTNRQRRG